MGDNTNTKHKDGVNRNARLIVRNISFKATEDALRDHFKSYGTVEEVKLLKKPDGRLVGCGFVHFTHVPEANNAISATNKKEFLGRPIYVTWAVPKHKYGEVKEEDAKKKTINVTSSDDEDDSKPDVKKIKTETKQEKINRNARLVVRNVSFKATESSLKEHFEPYGTIQEVKLLKKPDGKLVGCAFVHYKNVPMAKKALLNTNLKPFLGRPISVDWAVPKDKYMRHIVNQQLEMQEDVKKEDSDSDDEGPPLNLSNEDLKEEVKSESDDGSEKSDDDGSNSESKESEEEDSGSEDDNDKSEEEEDSDEEDIDMEDNQSVTSSQPAKQRIQLKDAEDDCTVFITNIPFSVDDQKLQEFAERTGEVKYAKICMDKLTEHSRGTGFIKFLKQEDAANFLSLPPEQLRLQSQVLVVKPALNRESLQKGPKKQAKDNRNLYLVKEGVIPAGSKAALGVSPSDMAKRMALERSKTQMLKNLNRFVSRFRLVVSNLPPSLSDARLRAVCARAAAAPPTEARVMRDLRAPLGRDGQHPSKGFGFVMFTRHEDALTCLRNLNNNPDVFTKNSRPIVSFSIEDKAALNARKKRLEKSIAKNPLAKRKHTTESETGESGDTPLAKRQKVQENNKSGKKVLKNKKRRRYFKKK